MSDKNEKPAEGFTLKDVPEPLRVFTLFAATVAAAMLITYVVAFWSVIPGASQEAWGQFGDFMGGILNPLVAFAALIALLYATALQRRELQATNAELKRSAEAMQAQHQVLELQAFESTFFKLAEHQMKLRDLEETRLNQIPNRIDSFLYEDMGYNRNYSSQECYAALLALRRDDHLPDFDVLEPFVAHFLLGLRFINQSSCGADRKAMYHEVFRSGVNLTERVTMLYFLVLRFDFRPDELKLAMHSGLFEPLPESPIYDALIAAAKELLNGELQAPAPAPVPVPTIPATEPA